MSKVGTVLFRIAWPRQVLIIISRATMFCQRHEIDTCKHRTQESICEAGDGFSRTGYLRQDFVKFTQSRSSF